MDEILAAYATDQRTSDGTEGPGPTIAENVQLYRMMRETP